MIRISLIIPTYNRAFQLLRALESVVLQDLPLDEWECVVVNNRSTDDTEERFAEFQKAHPTIPLRMVYEPVAGLSAARNCGIRATNAPYVAFIDDDEHVNSEFLRAYVEFFDAHPSILAAGGRIIAEYPEGRPQWMSYYTELPIANPLDLGAEPVVFPKGKIPGGGNMAFRREVFRWVEGFDVKLGRIGKKTIGGEDNDFFERLHMAGKQVWYVPCAVMWHVIPPEKLTEEYFRKLSLHVGVSQRLRAEIHHRVLRLKVGECLKWCATLALCFTLSPLQSRWLLKLRRGISQGVFTRPE